jgi:hypothetical protein
MTPAPLPCPFCGSDVTLNRCDPNQVCCAVCGAMGPMESIDREPVLAWNDVASLKAMVEEAEQAKQNAITLHRQVVDALIAAGFETSRVYLAPAGCIRELAERTSPARQAN